MLAGALTERTEVVGHREGREKGGRMVLVEGTVAREDAEVGSEGGRKGGREGDRSMVDRGVAFHIEGLWTAIGVHAGRAMAVEGRWGAGAKEGEKEGGGGRGGEAGFFPVQGEEQDSTQMEDVRKETEEWERRGMEDGKREEGGREGRAADGTEEGS
jgi:hypothetical protein